MRNLIYPCIIGCLLIFALRNTNLLAQEATPSMELWNNLLDKPELASYFANVFNTLGIIVSETNEKFTVHHLGDHFSLSQGIDEDKVDYVAQIKLQNLKNMAAHGKDASISNEESYKILSVLFTPLTKASLATPMLSRPLMRRLAGIENHIHVFLISPDQNEMNAHTLIYLNKKWMVIEGIHGKASRVFKLSPDQTLEYQRHIFVAMSKNQPREWRKFKKWYLTWRNKVSVVN